MANYSSLKSAVTSVIKTNGNNEITGQILQQTLVSIINSLGANYQFAGVAKPSTNPGTPDQNVFYIAGPGTYSNFGTAQTIATGNLGVFKYNGSWVYESVPVGKNYDPDLLKFVPIKNRTNYLFLGGNYIDNKRLTQTGGEYANSDCLITDFIPINPSTQYCYSSTDQFNAPIQVGQYVAFYDENCSFISSAQKSTSGPSFVFSTPATAKFVKLTFYKPSLQYSPMLNVGTTRALYEPYNPISGYLDVDDVPTEDSQKFVKSGGVFSEMVAKSFGVNLYNGEYTNNGYRFNLNGTLTSSSGNAVTIFIPVKPSTQYCYSSGNTSEPAMQNGHYVCYYDREKAFLSSSQNSGGNIMTFITPENCYFIRLTLNLGAIPYGVQLQLGSTRTAFKEYTPIGGYFAEKVQKDTIGTDELKIGAVQNKNIADDSVTAKKTDFITILQSENLLPLGGWESGYYNLNGTEGVSDVMCRKKVSLDGPGTYKFYVYRAFYGSGAANIPMYDANGNYVKTINGTLDSTNNVALNTIVVTAEDIALGCAKIGMSYFSNNAVPEYPLSQLMLIKGATYPATFIPYSHAQVFEGFAEDSKMVGKSVVFDGDSICAGLNSASGDYGNGWAGRIGPKNGMSWYNVGVSGGVITQGLGVSHCLSLYIDTIYSEHPQLDYLILEGGTNDADRLLGLNKDGEMSDTDFSGNYDATTFIGAVETLFYKVQNYYPNTKVGFIIAQKMGLALNAESQPDAYVINRRHFFDLIEQVCKKWGIPYIDLWKAGYLNPNVVSMYDKTLTSEQNRAAGKAYYDGQHLTAVGYDLISPKIESWMKTL